MKQTAAKKKSEFFILGARPVRSHYRRPLPSFFKKVGLVPLFLLFFTVLSYPDTPIWKVIMAEAVSEGYEGMYAVACVIRNRGGDLHGFCGAKRKDLSVFCNRQGRRAISQARKIEERVFEFYGPDTTKGATHFENIEAFGVPYWAKSMTITTKIGRHTFYKRK